MQVVENHCKSKVNAKVPSVLMSSRQRWLASMSKMLNSENIVKLK